MNPFVLPSQGLALRKNTNIDHKAGECGGDAPTQAGFAPILAAAPEGNP